MKILVLSKYLHKTFPEIYVLIELKRKAWSDGVFLVSKSNSCGFSKIVNSTHKPYCSNQQCQTSLINLETPQGYCLRCEKIYMILNAYAVWTISDVSPACCICSV